MSQSKVQICLMVCCYYPESQYTSKKNLSSLYRGHSQRTILTTYCDICNIVRKYFPTIYISYCARPNDWCVLLTLRQSYVCCLRNTIISFFCACSPLVSLFRSKWKVCNAALYSLSRLERKTFIRYHKRQNRRKKQNVIMRKNNNKRYKAKELNFH